MVGGGDHKARAMGWGLLALGLGVLGCGLEGGFSDPSDDGGGTDTDPPTGEDGPVPPGGECSSDAECGFCASCEGGVCVEEGFCCAAAQDWGFRCSPQECFADGDCAVNETCEAGGCVPVPPEPPDAPQATPLCDDPTSLTMTTLSLGVALRDLAVLDVDADGIGEIVTIDGDEILSALTPDGTVVATLDLAGHVAHEMWAVEGTSLLIPGATEAGMYALARIDVAEPGVLAISTSMPVPGDLGLPTRVRDFDGDGALELGAIAGTRLHQWELEQPPALAVDAGFEAEDQIPEAIDVDGDGESELLALDEQGLWRITIADGEVTFGEYAALPGLREDSTIVSALGEPDRLIVASENPLFADTPATLLSVVVGTADSPKVREPFGAPHPFGWMIDVDLDGDGNDELVVAYSTGDRPMHVYRLHPDATPQCYTPIDGAGMDHPTAGDVTGDGLADLVVRDGIDIQVWSLTPPR